MKSRTRARGRGRRHAKWDERKTRKSGKDIAFEQIEGADRETERGRGRGLQAPGSDPRLRWGEKEEKDKRDNRERGGEIEGGGGGG